MAPPPARQLPATARLRPALLGIALSMAIALAASSCSSQNNDPVDAATDATSADASPPAPALVDAGPASVEPEQVASGPREFGAEALVISDHPDIASEIRYEDPAFAPPLIAPGDIRSGGPEPDGIPAIDRPRFHPVADVEALNASPETAFLGDNEPVFVLEIDGDARAYPIQILMWHEIVNDTVGGVPVSVTFCPLCNSAFAFDRRVGDRVVDFGVSGQLWNSSMVMYDRQTRSLWAHFTGQAVLGVLSGTQLETFPVTLASWKEFRDAHPDGLVLSRDTGFVKDYGRNPYVGYDDVDKPPFAFDGKTDGRYPAKTRIVALELDDRPIAIIAELLETERVVPVTAGPDPVVVWWQPGTGSALDAKTVADGRDVGTTSAFVPLLDGRSLSFEPLSDGGFVDGETSSTWNVFGTAVAGPLAGSQLPAVTHLDTFWFAWAAFHPDSEIIDVTGR